MKKMLISFNNYFKGPWSLKSNAIWGFVNVLCTIFNAFQNHPVNWMIAVFNAYAAFLCFRSAFRQYKAELRQ